MINSEYINIIRSLLSLGEHVEMNFKGNSMLPTIPNTCKILISKPDVITVGSIYVYISPEPYSSLVCHRLVAQSGEKLFFQGDNRNNADLFVTRGSVIGRCTAYILNNRLIPLDGGET